MNNESPSHWTAEELFTVYRPFIESVLIEIGVPPDDRADMAGAVALKLARCPADRLPPRARPPLRWLAVVTRNAVRSATRTRAARLWRAFRTPVHAVRNRVTDPGADPVSAAMHADPAGEAGKWRAMAEAARRIVVGEEGTLTARERLVVAHCFGLVGEPETLTDVGRRLGVSRWRVRQVLDVAIEKLRRDLTSTRPRPVAWWALS